MGGINRIGIIGLTGVGKSTAAQHLRDVHGFEIGSTGAVCRGVSRLLYGTEDKSKLLALTDALQALDPAIFLKAALRTLPVEKSFVIDALRYTHDYDYAKLQHLYLIRITAPLHLRRQRLQERGQIFDFETDGKHPSELQLNEVAVHATLENDGTKRQLFTRIDGLLNQNGASPS
jgi:dephospho-CoA kinase